MQIHLPLLLLSQFIRNASFNTVFSRTVTKTQVGEAEELSK